MTVLAKAMRSRRGIVRHALKASVGLFLDTAAACMVSTDDVRVTHDQLPVTLLSSAVPAGRLSKAIARPEARATGPCQDVRQCVAIMCTGTSDKMRFSQIRGHQRMRSPWSSQLE